MDELVTVQMLKSEKDKIKEVVDYIGRLDTAIVQRWLDNMPFEMATLTNERDKQYKVLADVVRPIFVSGVDNGTG